MAGSSIKSILFADQSLDEVVGKLSPPAGDLADAVAALRAGNAGEAEVILGTIQLTRPDEFRAWHRLLLAAARVARKKPDAATTLLHEVAVAPGDSRVRLWAWRALRDLGQPPSAEAATQILGVVVEVENGRGVETLAAYDDLSARYLLPTGARFIWDNPDGRLRDEIQAVLAAAHAHVGQFSSARLDGVPATGQVRTTLLTPAGLLTAEEPLADLAADKGPRAPVFAATTALLVKILAVARW